MLFVLTKEVIVEFTRLAQLSMPGGITSEMLVVSNPSGSLLRYIASIQLYLQDGVSITDKLARIKLLELLLCLSADDHSILKEVLDIREQFRSKITGVVEENIMNSLTLRQLARLSGRSLSSFRRDFSSIYNMPPSRWIRLKRLEKALELLTNTNMTITDICYTLGFENVAHFSRIFKLQFHYPPSEIRLKCLAG
jgi:transcriptional regulator GlxA family with amidase domain